ncbi:hypothetical protein [Roseivivax sp. CAU 1761]
MAEDHTQSSAETATPAPPWRQASPDLLPAVLMAERWTAFGAEWMDFAARRARAGTEAQQRILHCSNALDAQVELLRYGCRMLDDYQREGARLADMLAGNGAAPEDAADEASRNVAV